MQPKNHQSHSSQGSGHCAFDIDSQATTIANNNKVNGKYVAAFQSSELGWAFYRAFKYLHARVILD
jgi:hypothetical protein